MNRPPFLAAAILLSCLGAAGCFTAKLQVKDPPVSGAKVAKVQQAINQKKQKATKVKMPATLGGIISSDSWVIFQEKQEEEFKGNVRYANDVYSFRSEYALSQRAQNLITATGKVYLKQLEKDDSYYEAFSDTAIYNYQTGRGSLEAAKGKKIKLIYKSAKEDVTAYARKAGFNTQKQTYNLYGDVVVLRREPATGLTTLKAQKMSLRKLDNYAILQGNAQVITPNYNVDAETLEYDGKNNVSYAYGARPLARGTTEDGTFAIIADRAAADNEGHKIVLTGKVQGWVVSDQINKADFNDKF